MPEPIRPLLGHGGPHQDVWLVYSRTSGGIHKAFLTEPDPTSLALPPGTVVAKFFVGRGLLARLGTVRVRGQRLVARGAAAYAGTIL